MSDRFHYPIAIKSLSHKLEAKVKKVSTIRKTDILCFLTELQCVEREFDHWESTFQDTKRRILRFLEE